MYIVQILLKHKNGVHDRNKSKTLSKTTKSFKRAQKVLKKSFRRNEFSNSVHQVMESFKCA